MEPYMKKALAAKPSDRQLQWQQLEFYGFIHFSINTFTGKEWGNGQESPELFNPSELDTDQWVDAFKSAGMKGIIFTAKHHDGFCLWPSAHTDHSVKNSPWKNGRGDVLRELSQSCSRAGMKLGIYLSPWDRHDSRYDTDEYNDYFKAQLREVLTAYGEIFEVWFDGACGEGKNGIKQVYDWPGYFQVIRELQPQAVIANVGPDVRWCGNEAGWCRPSEWSVVPSSLFDIEMIASNSQQEDSETFIQSYNAEDNDLGSREKIRTADSLIWYPSEVNTSIRPGWFYHKNQDGRVKSLNELFNLYCRAVGGNNTLLLNVPPDHRGLIADADVKRLAELGDSIEELNRVETLAGQTVSEIQNSESTGIMEITLPSPVKINFMFIQEDIEKGQRIESFHVQVPRKGNWQAIYSGTTVGYKKICRFTPVRTDRIRFQVTGSRDIPRLKNLQVNYFDKVGKQDLKGKMRMALVRLGDKIFSFYMRRIK